MNEQIKKLLEQSGLQPYYDAQEGQIEKFAELLVRKCITICTPDISGRLDGQPYETADEFDRGFIDGQDCCVELIKEHFGVKE